MSKIDYSIIGNRYGRLLVLDFDCVDRNGARFLCRCDCGNTKSINANNLKSGHTTSCGCKHYGMRTKDLTGERFGRLTVLCFDRLETSGRQYWRCRCDCENEVVVERSNLIRGTTASCGCKQRDAATTHGMTNTPLFRIWSGMKYRCSSINHESYDRYGGRGISVCSEWHDFRNFLDWSINNGYEDGLTIDRINNDDGYHPENCRWVDYFVQNNNTSSNRRVTYNDITHTIAEWARLFDVRYGLLYERINRGDMRDFENYFNDEGCNNV